MYTQKLYKNGNSVVVSIPRQVLLDLGLRDGSEVNIAPTNNSVVIRRLEKKRNTKKKDFYSLLEKVNTEYGEALEELAHK